MQDLYELYNVYSTDFNGKEHLNLGPVGITYHNGSMEEVILKTSHNTWNTKGNGSGFVKRAETIYHNKENLPEKWNIDQVTEMANIGKASLKKPLENTVTDVLDHIIDRFIK